MIYGTLDTRAGTAAVEARAGVGMAMLELSWAELEPQQNVVDAGYLAGLKSRLAAYHAAGMRVTLGLGMHDTPSWVFRLPGSTYTDQDGNVCGEANFVHSRAVRRAAERYMSVVAAALPLPEFWAVRLTSGGNCEMLYPGGGRYWAFGNAALTGDGLAPGMRPNPFPGWRPGHGGLGPEQVDQWVDWYVGGLADVTRWQMRHLSGLGFTGYYQTVTPGSGTRPGGLDPATWDGRNDETTCVGAVWHRYYAMLPARANVMAYISSVADTSGGDDVTQPSDGAIPLDSPAMDRWSATRWITRVARQHGLAVGGENPGYGMPASLNAHYTDTSASGMMASALRQARAAGFEVFYWAHDFRLWDGTLPFSCYAGMIRGAGRPGPRAPW
jgi:hypothetical protein